jgi:hypothetical protein
LSWIAGSEGFSRRGSGKGFVLLMGTSVETILQISINYLDYPPMEPEQPTKLQ